MHKSKLAAILVCFAVTAPSGAQDSSIAAAEQFFAQYAALERAYDSSMAELYADEALIKTKRKYPMGEAGQMIIPAAQYKTMLRELIPIAKARGDRCTYSNVTYTQEGAFVRIDALRFTEPRKYTSPISLLVGRSPRGSWLIYEESSESQP